MVAQAAVVAMEVGCGALGPGWPASRRGLRIAAAIAALATGGVLAGGAARVLGPALTPMPRPRKAGSFHDDGPYRLVRHPIYGGVLLLATGGALATSPLAMVPAAMLGVLFAGKSRREEVWLAERYPQYARYSARVRRRFVPFVW